MCLLCWVKPQSRARAPACGWAASRAAAGRALSDSCPSRVSAGLEAVVHPDPLCSQVRQLLWRSSRLCKGGPPCWSTESCKQTCCQRSQALRSGACRALCHPVTVCSVTCALCNVHRLQLDRDEAPKIERQVHRRVSIAAVVPGAAGRAGAELRELPRALQPGSDRGRGDVPRKPQINQTTCEKSEENLPFSSSWQVQLCSMQWAQNYRGVLLLGACVDLYISQ